MPTLQYTSAMQKRLTQRTAMMLHAALRHFPELRHKTITVGHTRAHLGVALREQFIIRLRVRHLSYNTIGHELTHLIQGQGGVPEGEKPCDIWTLARSPLFCDDAPTYLALPPYIRAQWQHYALCVRSLCVQAIQVRQTHRNYIQWLERQLSQLERAEARHTGQLSFSF